MKQQMDKEMKKEMRKLLTGQTIRNEDGWLVAIPQGNRLIYHGASDNTGRKIVNRATELEVDEADTEELFQRILRALQTWGLLVSMSTWPEALCGLKRYFFTKTVILCVAPADSGALTLVAYTGRSLFSGYCCNHAIKQFQKLLQS